MDAREMLIELLAQTIAPRLYQLCGQKSEEMGFPIYDTKEEVDDHLERQFNPVGYWLTKAREIADGVIRIAEAGGVKTEDLNLDAMIAAAARERPDVTEDGTQRSLDELV